MNKEKLLEQAKQEYYHGDGATILSDAEYDSLQDLNTDSLPSIPSNSRFPIVNHEMPMYSLPKSKTFSEIEKWLDSIGKKLSDTIIQKKLDGLSLEAVYDQGILISAILRGDGIQGENVLENAKKFLPEKVNYQPRFSVHGEVVIRKDKFEQLPEGAYANRRNSVSGILRRLDGMHCEKLSFPTYDIVFADKTKTITTETKKIAALQLLGFETVSCNPYNKNILNDWESQKDGIYLLDGCVFKLNDSLESSSLGLNADGKPKGQMALKFTAEVGITYAREIVWECNKEKLSPVLICDPVLVSGSKLSRVSLASINVFSKFDLYKGSKVLIKKANDVIPYLSEKLVYQDQETTEKFELPTVCPACGANTTISDSGSQLLCSNDNCSGKILAILSNALKSVWKTKGFGEALLKQLIKSDLITDVTSIYWLTPEQINASSNMSLERCKEFHFLLQAALKHGTLTQFFTAAGVLGAAEKSLQKIESKYSIKQVIEFDEETCRVVFGKASGAKFFASKSKIQNLLNNLLALKNSL